MKITSVEFVKSVVSVDHIPKERLNEVAFAGRSNVGKSSLINCLLNRKKMAKTSSTPGKTRQLNYFRVNHRYYFVDLPGYGFAKVPQQERLRWQELIEGYLTRSKYLKGVISIIDCRIGATPLDLQLLEWLHSLDRTVIVVATKADKLSKSALKSNIQKLEAELKPFLNDRIVPFSAVSGAGKRELSRDILNLVE